MRQRCGQIAQVQAAGLDVPPGALMVGMIGTPAPPRGLRVLAGLAGLQGHQPLHGLQAHGF